MAWFLQNGWYQIGKRGRSKKCLRQNNNLEHAEIHLAINLISIEAGIPELEFYSLAQLEDTLHRLSEEMEMVEPEKTEEKETEKKEEGEPVPGPEPEWKRKYDTAELEDFAERTLFSGRTSISPALTFTIMAWAWGLRGEKQNQFLGLAIHKMSMPAMRPNTPPMSPPAHLNPSYSVGFNPYGQPVPIMNDYMSSMPPQAPDATTPPIPILPHIDTIEGRMALAQSRSGTPHFPSPPMMPMAYMPGMSPSPGPMHPHFAPPPPSDALVYRDHVFSPVQQIQMEELGRAPSRASKRSGSRVSSRLSHRRIRKERDEPVVEVRAIEAPPPVEYHVHSRSSAASIESVKTPLAGPEPIVITKEMEEYMDRRLQQFMDQVTKTIGDMGAGIVDQATKKAQEEVKRTESMVAATEARSLEREKTLESRMNTRMVMTEDYLHNAEIQLTNNYDARLCELQNDSANLQATLQAKLDSHVARFGEEKKMLEETLKAGLDSQMNVIKDIKESTRKMKVVEEGPKFDQAAEISRLDNKISAEISRLDNNLSHILQNNQSADIARLDNTISRLLRDNELQVKEYSKTFDVLADSVEHRFSEFDKYKKAFKELADAVDLRFSDLVHGKNETRKEMGILVAQVQELETSHETLTRNLESLHKIFHEVALKKDVEASEAQLGAETKKVSEVLQRMLKEIVAMEDRLSTETQGVKDAFHDILGQVAMKKDVVALERELEAETKRISEGLQSIAREVVMRDSPANVDAQLEETRKLSEEMKRMLQDVPSKKDLANLEAKLEAESKRIAEEARIHHNNLSTHVNSILDNFDYGQQQNQQDTQALLVRFTDDFNRRIITMQVSLQEKKEKESSDAHFLAMTETQRQITELRRVVDEYASQSKFINFIHTDIENIHNRIAALEVDTLTAITKLETETNEKIQDLDMNIEAGLSDNMQKVLLSMHDGARQIVKRMKKHVTKTNNGLVQSFNGVITDRTKIVLERMDAMEARADGIDKDLEENKKTAETLKKETETVKKDLDLVTSDFRSHQETTLMINKLLHTEIGNINQLEQYMEVLDGKVDKILTQKETTEVKLDELLEQRAVVADAVIHLANLKETVEGLAKEGGKGLDTVGKEEVERLDSALKEMGRKLEGTQSDLEGKAEALRTELEGRLDTLQEDLDGKTGTLRTNVDGKLYTIQKELEGDVDSLRKDLQNDLSTLKDTTSTLEKFRNDFDLLNGRVQFIDKEVEDITQSRLNENDHVKNRFSLLNGRLTEVEQIARENADDGDGIKKQLRGLNLRMSEIEEFTRGRSGEDEFAREQVQRLGGRLSRIEEVEMERKGEEQQVKEQIGYLNGRMASVGDKTAAVERDLVLMQPKVDVFSSKIADFESWIALIEGRITAFEPASESVEKEKERLAALEAKVRDVEHRTSIHEESIVIFENNVERLNENHLKLDENQRKLDENQQAFDQEAEELTKDLHTFKAEIGETLTSILDSMENLKQAETTLGQKLEEAKEGLVVMIDKVAELAQDGNKALKDRLDRFEAGHDAFVEGHDEQITKIAQSIDQEATALTLRLNDIVEKHHTFTRDLELAQESYSANLENVQMKLRKDIEAVHNDLYTNFNDLHSTFTDLSGSIGVLGNKFVDLDTKVTDLDTEVGNAQDDLDTVIARCDHVSKQLSEETTHMNSRIEDISNRCEDISTEASQVSQQLTTVVDFGNDSRTTLNKHATLITTLSKHVSNQNRIAMTLQQQTEKHGTQITSLNTTVNTLSSAAGRVGKEIDQIKETKRQAKQLMAAMSEQRVCACEERHRKKERDGREVTRQAKRKKSIVKFSGI